MKSKSLLAISLLVVTSNLNAEVRLWASQDRNTGNFGGRAGLDTHCDTDGNKPTPNIANSTTRAFISVDSNDEIRDMPTNYSIPTDEVIYRADGTTRVAANFTALLNVGSTPLENSIGVFSSVSNLVWTGSNSSGIVTSSTCVGWTSDSSSGSNGQQNITGPTSISMGSVTCSASIRTYCITYTPPTPAPAPVQGSSSPLKTWE